MDYRPQTSQERNSISFVTRNTFGVLLSWGIAYSTAINSNWRHEMRTLLVSYASVTIYSCGISYLNSAILRITSIITGCLWGPTCTPSDHNELLTVSSNWSAVGHHFVKGKNSKQSPRLLMSLIKERVLRTRSGQPWAVIGWELWAWLLNIFQFVQLLVCRCMSQSTTKMRNEG